MEVARYIVASFQERGDLITNLKLQKLLYYVQGWYLGLNGERAFDGDFQAWVHGPVNYPVYQEFRGLRWNPIVEDMSGAKLDKELAEFVDTVLEVYGGDSAWELERRTHGESPWLIARGDLERDAECRNVIDDESLKAFFASEAQLGDYQEAD